MSEKRKGLGNPASKIIVWNYEKYTTTDFKKMCKENGIKKETYEKILSENKPGYYRDYEIKNKQYEILHCPHCNKSSGGKIYSGFSRWHMNNCKERK